MANAKKPDVVDAPESEEDAPILGASAVVPEPPAPKPEPTPPITEGYVLLSYIGPYGALYDTVTGQTFIRGASATAVDPKTAERLKAHPFDNFDIETVSV